MRIDETKIEEDMKVPADIRTFKIMEKIANSIDSTIIMTAECPSMHPENDYKLPYLDISIWVDKNDKKLCCKIFIINIYHKSTKPQ